MRSWFGVAIVFLTACVGIFVLFRAGARQVFGG